MAKRTSFDLLPVEGPKFPRDISRTVNQAMSGKTNNVGDISYLGQEIVDAGFVITVRDIRVSEQSYIHMEPLSDNAFLLSSLITDKGKGFFTIRFTDPDNPLGYGQGQIFDETPISQPVVADVWEQIVSPDFAPEADQINVTNNNGVLTFSEPGTYAITAACSFGATPFPNTFTVNFGGIINNDQARAFGLEWTRRSNTAGIPMTFSGYASIQGGDTLAAAVKLNTTGTVEFDSVNLSAYTIGVPITPPLFLGESFEYRYVVVG